MSRGAAETAELCVHCERTRVASRFGRDFYGYELVVCNRGPGEASSIEVALVATADDPWTPHLVGRRTDLNGTTVIPRLAVEDSERLAYETVCDDAVVTRCTVSWVDGSGPRSEELAVASSW